MAHQYKILLVEDNIDDEQLCVRALKRVSADMQISVARDGAEALECLRSAPPQLPDLVLLDLRLPKISGLEVLRRIREDERTSDLAVMVLACPDEPFDQRAAHQQHANGFIHKPVDAAEFEAAVRELGIEWVQTVN